MLQKFLRPLSRKRGLVPRKSSLQQDWQPIQETLQEYYDEDGRRYLNVPYLLPKDFQENQRLTCQHFILRQALKGNICAPVHSLLQRVNARILDVGCGTSIWGYDVAEAYPDAKVIGMDLEHIPRSMQAPENYSFQHGDILQTLPFADQTFHYTHQRLLVAAIPANAWTHVVRELVRVTCPGGWIELVEAGSTYHRYGPATHQLLTWGAALSQQRGIDPPLVQRIGHFLLEAGLLNIKSRTLRLPVGEWGGRLGKLLAQDMLSGFRNLRGLCASQLSISPEQFDEVTKSLESEWSTLHTQYDFYLAYGLRP